jgi:type IV pilus assembly protein PilA
MKDLAMRLRARAQTAEIEGEEVAEAGFTLIELMVVLLIIAILLAIAIPTFLGVTNNASDRAAQSNLTNAVTEAKTLYEIGSTYTTAAAAYSSQAPEFTWGANSNCAAATATQNCVSFEDVDAAQANDSQGIILAVWSAKTTTCWFAVDLEATPAPITGDTPGTSFDQGGDSTEANAGVYYGKISKPATCSASLAVNPTAATWGASYTTAGTV